MNIEVHIIDGLVTRSALPDCAAEAGATRDDHDGAGALVTFEGIARPTEAGRAIDGLRYDAYEPMASRQLHKLAAETVERFGLLALHVAHSRGFVPAGCCSFRLRIRSRHRQEALQAAEYFIDALKRDVPIWKTAIFSSARTTTGAV